jgi:hypothetical protein
MARTLAHGAGPAARYDAGGVWAAVLVVALLAAAVWGAWRLGVMAGDKVDLRRSITDIPPALRKAPNPQPMPIPTQRRPAVEAQQR